MPKMPKMPKIAIMLTGHIRSWNNGCKQSFIKMFNKYNPDVYVITYHTMDYKSESRLLKEEIQFNLRDINVVDIVVKDENEVYEESKKYKDFCNGDADQFCSTMCQYINLKNCFKMVQDSEKKYDYVIKTRFDLKYHFNEDIFKDHHQIFTSNQCCACDFFACGTYEQMARYSGLIDNVERIYKQYFYPDIQVTPHMLLHYNLLGGYTNNLHVEVVKF
jgi:hypothetical protein